MSKVFIVEMTTSIMVICIFFFTPVPGSHKIQVPAWQDKHDKSSEKLAERLSC